MAIKPFLVQQRLAETGRIRIGHRKSSRSGKPFPAKIDKFRFTSPSRSAVTQVAAAYGGKVAPWKPDPKAPGQWEVFTDAGRIPVIVPPRTLNQYMELWTDGGCQRRCDGDTETRTGQPCLCRQAGALACKPTTRLTVMLADVQGLGVWRLESHGWTAAAELPPTVNVMSRLGSYVSAYLYLKTIRRTFEGQVREFIVPGLEVEGITPAALAARIAKAAEVAPPQPGLQQISQPDEERLQAEPSPAAVAAAPDQAALPAPAHSKAGGPVKQKSPHLRKLPDNAELWQRIVAAWPGDSLTDLQQAFAAANDGRSPEEASCEQLSAFLASVQNQLQRHG